jgi:hypothetical protein
MTTTHTTTYTKATPVGEPIEIRFTRGGSGRDGFVKRYVLTAFVTERGTVGHYLTEGDDDASWSLSTLQHRGPSVFPSKALPGWQAEVVAFAFECLFPVEEVR